jgi:23S rRNA (uridine2552-2'-O)-methyltransferase
MAKTSYEKPDYWAIRAQKEGYPARSVYKLDELAGKFPLLPRDFSHLRALDMGAAPGSWSLFLLRKMAGRGFLAAADLAPLSRQYDRGLFDGENFFFLQGDLTAPEIRRILIGHGPYSLLLSDAAPATTGSRSVDTPRSLALAEEVLLYAETVLGPGGSMVVKVFQGGDSAGLLRRIRDMFETGKSFKPAACRAGSFETYYVGLGFKK